MPPQQVRGALYASLYNELFTRVPHHPQLTRKTSPQETQEAVSTQLELIQPYLGKETEFTAFLEIGAGDYFVPLQTISARHLLNLFSRQTPILGIELL